MFTCHIAVTPTMMST